MNVYLPKGSVIGGIYDYEKRIFCLFLSNGSNCIIRSTDIDNGKLDNKQRQKLIENAVNYGLSVVNGSVIKEKSKSYKININKFKKL